VLRVASVVLALLLAGCESPARTLTLAVALLPSELPGYREVIRGFEATSGWRVTVVPQQYADIRRALAAEAHGGSGTPDLVELAAPDRANPRKTRRTSLIARRGELPRSRPCDFG
jgi:hypothetical protein